MKKENIRNFAIIAHIDHGKSTLADRILEFTHSVTKREIHNQMLDTMDLERERGITIKLNAVQIEYQYQNQIYQLNLIDTPGHVDFTYEVSRSLAASEGAILLVDATQGVQPQTIANLYLAIENDLKIIPVINKIDSENANILKTKQEIKEILGIDASDAPLISAKTGKNIEEVLIKIINDIPPPLNADDNLPLKGLVFDAYFDSYQGVILFVKIFQGFITKNQKLTFIQSKTDLDVISVGVNTPKEKVKEKLNAGETGWIITNIKDIKKISIGDTLTTRENKDKIKALPGYRPSKPMVFSGFYPLDTEKYQGLEEALDKISLSDSSLSYEKENSKALGFGFRVGFLGLLHLEIIQERIEREFKIPVIATIPSVIYKVTLTNKKIKYIQNPVDFPDKSYILQIEEPYVKVTIYSPENYMGKLIEYVHSKRGIYQNLEIYSEKMNALIYHLPLGEIVFDFFNAVKSISKGYASFDYEQIGYQKGDLVKLDFLIAKEQVDAFSRIVDRKNAYQIAKVMVEKLKEIVPRQNFEIAIQAVIGGKVIARETVKAYRKDVTGYLYGGDVSRKKKLLEKQKKGKKKMKQIGSVTLPKNAFIDVLKTK
ncbi:Elongation factor 4 [Candidatus Hepatoplasma crinochetorum Av]|uniref:Elongation factor 4 n=1 Tax=Candidatus Hepatoplasma crinochetorum Av TaxID=1427984 RepID=W8GN80_9MOLU|nr:translation elongation factor 4 [Candidatus Hepatoplasma crinochetorum]AHK22471.1 Elongation factor 4 [Candidatus Hepatoplasma crinochetorum Av]